MCSFSRVPRIVRRLISVWGLLRDENRTVSTTASGVADTSPSMLLVELFIIKTHSRSLFSYFIDNLLVVHE